MVVSAIIYYNRATARSVRVDDSIRWRRRRWMVEAEPRQYDIMMIYYHHRRQYYIDSNNEWAEGEGVVNDDGGGGGNVVYIDGGGGGYYSFFFSFWNFENLTSICRWITWSNPWFSWVHWQKIDIWNSILLLIDRAWRDDPGTTTQSIIRRVYADIWPKRWNLAHTWHMSCVRSGVVSCRRSILHTHTLYYDNLRRISVLGCYHTSTLSYHEMR